MQKRIYFVRHGQVDNPQDIWYGRLSGYGLSGKGKAQIEQTTNFLKTKNISSLYSSPLLRAKQTAEILNAGLHVPFSFSDDLLEVDSSLQGKSYSYLKSINYDVFFFAGRDIKGETIEEIKERMLHFMKTAKGETIAAVSHGDPLMILRLLLNNMSMDNKQLRTLDNYIQPGEVYLVTTNDGMPISLESVFTPLG